MGMAEYTAIFWATSMHGLSHLPSYTVQEMFIFGCQSVGNILEVVYKVKFCQFSGSFEPRL